jgi:hypothetical protein
METYGIKILFLNIQSQEKKTHEREREIFFWEELWERKK